MEQVIARICWNGMTVEVRYAADHSVSYRKIVGYALAHLEVRSVTGEPLPISETGYRSHFERADNIAADGGPIGYVRAWLDHAESAPEWLAAREAARQFVLL